MTHYDSTNRAANGFAGDASGGAARGVLPEGSLGITSDREELQFLNTDTEEAQRHPELCVLERLGVSLGAHDSRAGADDARFLTLPSCPS